MPGHRWNAWSSSARTLRIVALVALGALAACERGGDDADDVDESRQGGTLVIGSPSDLSVLNVFLAADQWTQEVNRSVLYTPLLRYTPELDFEPALAESWEATDTSATFHLRHDMRWHDGRPTTAEDVVFTLETARDTASGYPNAGYFARWRSVAATDSYTVHVRFDAHPEPLAGVPITPIMPAHLLRDVSPADMRTAPYNQAPVGNGPFRFVSAAPGDRWTFEANTAYPEELGGRPYVDRLVWRVIPDNTAQTTALRTGEIDLAIGPRATELRQLDAEEGIHAVVKPGNNYFFIGWNGLRPPFDDARVRRALSMAIDRREILTALRGGYGELAAGPVSPHHWAHDSTVAPLPFSPDSARALLAQAGLRDRNGDGMVERADGSPFTIELKYPAQNPFNADVAEMVRADLAAAGVRVELRATEFGTMIGDVTSTARNFDAVQLGWTSDPDLAHLRSLFHSESMNTPFQSASYSNAEFDSLLDRATSTLDRDEARPLWRRVQEIMRDEQPWTFMFYYMDLLAARDWLHTPELDVRGTLANIGEWWIDPASRRRSGLVGDSVAADSTATDTVGDTATAGSAAGR
ncbi:MAG TPA: ABC transporter substrate-binding protein [Longimicrobiales bacterium]